MNVNAVGRNSVEACKTVFECLDKLGYSQEMIQYRRDMNKKMDEIYNSKPFAFRNLTTGAKSEGTALYYESDIDRLYEVKDVTCVEHGILCFSPTVFHLDRTGCSPGYTKLKLLTTYRFFHRAIEKYLIPESDGVYMSNNYSPFKQNENYVDINGVSLNKKDKAGPSSPFGNTSIKYDFVLGFKCDCPDLIEKWVKRPRHYKWPDQNSIRRVSLLHGHVVPVADKGSKNPQTEWRICYTRARLLLLQSLNEVQIKLYILLKHIAKSVLNP